MKIERRSERTHKPFVRVVSTAFASIVVGVILAAFLAGSGQVLAASSGRTITDQNKNVVALPDKFDRIVTSSMWPLTHMLYIVNGSADNIAGMHPASKSAGINSMFGLLSPSISKAITDFISPSDVLNIEELMKLNPDIVYYRGENTPEEEILLKSPIPSAAFRVTIYAGDAVETGASWIDQLGEIAMKDTIAPRYRERARKSMEMISERVKDIPDSKKPRVMIINRHSEKEIIVANKSYASYWIKQTGALNAAEELEASRAVNMEEIYKWNPDIIYITNFTPTLAEDLLKNKVNGQDWSGLSAVKNGRVYKNPLGMYRWYVPNSDAPMMLEWMAQKNYPELFRDIDIRYELREYYKEFYNYGLTEENLDMILNPAREGASGV
ncbi:MAG: ABC transporter substrate-binding protein [Synergistaceae bacterium]|nr:ABC transporter substrate-binding protein [Synergistaceae bacterium]